jgi:hypothetical protein
MTPASRHRPLRLNKWEQGRRTAPILLFGLGLALAGSGRGAPALVESEDRWGPGVSRLGDDQILIDEVFQSHLPTTMEKFTLRLSVYPHLGDWQDKDYMRVTTG